MVHRKGGRNTSVSRQRSEHGLVKFRKAISFLARKQVDMSLKNFSISSYTEELWDTFKYEYLSGFSGEDYVCTKESYSVPTSLLDFTQDVREFITPYGDVTIEGLCNGIVYLKNTKRPIFIVMSRERTRTTHVGEDSIDCEITADPEVTQELLRYLDDKYATDSPARAYWWFMAKDGPNSIALNLKNKNRIYPEFYPWINGDPERYFQNYLDSDAPLLFLSGPPGTGKTSFLRYMLCKLKLSAYVGYDIKLFANDEMFISFITDADITVLVMEDAESLVLPRDKGGNNMVSRFLNVSDGLIKFPNKKIIFTTNESNFEQIDHALIRPGRCYDFLEFRKLTVEEALAATKVAGLPPPPYGKSHTIAELFNPRTRLKVAAKVGFV